VAIISVIVLIIDLPNFIYLLVCPGFYPFPHISMNLRSFPHRMDAHDRHNERETNERTDGPREMRLIVRPPVRSFVSWMDWWSLTLSCRAKWNLGFMLTLCIRAAGEAGSSDQRFLPFFRLSLCTVSVVLQFVDRPMGWPTKLANAELSLKRIKNTPMRIDRFVGSECKRNTRILSVGI